MNNELGKMNKAATNSSSVPKEIVVRVNDALNPRVLARQVLIRGENKRDFFDFVAQLRKEMLIHTKIEEEFFKKYVFCVWRLRRLREMEKNILNKQQAFTKEEIIFSDVKRRIRNIKKVRISTDLREILIQQEKLEKQTLKALQQLRQEQRRNPQAGSSEAL